MSWSDCIFIIVLKQNGQDCFWADSNFIKLFGLNFCTGERVQIVHSTFKCLRHHMLASSNKISFACSMGVHWVTYKTSDWVAPRKWAERGSGALHFLVLHTLRSVQQFRIADCPSKFPKFMSVQNNCLTVSCCSIFSDEHCSCTRSTHLYLSPKYHFKLYLSQHFE